MTSANEELSLITRILVLLWHLESDGVRCLLDDVGEVLVDAYTVSLEDLVLLRLLNFQ